MQQNDTDACFIRMMVFFALALQLKLKVNRIFHSNAFIFFSKRVFYLSSLFSLLLDFVVSNTFVYDDTKYRLTEVTVIRSALHRRTSRCIECIQCIGNFDKYSHVSELWRKVSSVKHLKLSISVYFLFLFEENIEHRNQNRSIDFKQWKRNFSEGWIAWNAFAKRYNN